MVISGQIRPKKTNAQRFPANKHLSEKVSRLNTACCSLFYRKQKNMSISPAVMEMGTDKNALHFCGELVRMCR